MAEAEIIEEPSQQDTPTEIEVAEQLDPDLCPQCGELKQKLRSCQQYLYRARRAKEMYKQQLQQVGEVVVFSAKCWDRRCSYALIESATPCHDAQRCWWDLNPIHLTVLAAKSVDYNMAPQHLQGK